MEPAKLIIEVTGDGLEEGGSQPLPPGASPETPRSPTVPLPPAPNSSRPVADAPARREAVEVFRGVKPGNDPHAMEGTIGKGLFYSPKREVAEAYSKNSAGEMGPVAHDLLSFKNLLDAKSIPDAKSQLQLPLATPMVEIIAEAIRQGFDGITWETNFGREYVALPGHKSEPAPKTKEESTFGSADSPKPKVGSVQALKDHLSQHLTTHVTGVFDNLVGKIAGRGTGAKVRAVLREKSVAVKHHLNTGFQRLVGRRVAEKARAVFSKTSGAAKRVFSGGPEASVGRAAASGATRVAAGGAAEAAGAGAAAAGGAEAGAAAAGGAEAGAAGGAAAGGTLAAVAAPVAIALAAVAAAAYVGAKALTVAAQSAEFVGKSAAKIADNRYFDVFKDSVEVAASTLEKIPLIGGTLAEAVRSTSRAFTAAGDAANAFVERGRYLARYNSELGAAQGRARVNTILADVREAEALAPSISKTTENMNTMDVGMRDLLLPIKQALSELLAAGSSIGAEVVTLLSAFKPVIKFAVRCMTALPIAALELFGEVLKALRWALEKWGFKFGDPITPGDLNSMMENFLSGASRIAGPFSPGTRPAFGRA